jgi:hypothetical protein
VKLLFSPFVFIFLLLSRASAQTGPDVPVIQVHTEGYTAKAINTPRPYSRPKKHPKPIIVETQRVSVRVDLRSFRTPKVPYDVQCFAVAHSDADGSKYIYDVQHRSSSAAFDTVLFQTALIEEKKKWVLIPISRVAANGKIVSSSPVITKPMKGVKYYGWVVRVVSNNVAVRHESNQQELRTAAEKTPEAFDTAVTEID